VMAAWADYPVAAYVRRVDLFRDHAGAGFL
jgi:hypothetical protein